MTLEIQTVVALVTIIAAACSGATFLLTRGRSEGEEKSQIKAAESLSQAALAKLELFNSQFRDHEIKDASSFARLETLVTEHNRSQAALETRLIASMNDLKDEQKGTNARLDEMSKTLMEYLRGRGQ